MRVFIIAGEASGDALGAALIAGMASEVPGVALEGVGGPLMEAEGLTSLFPMDALSVMGVAEVLPRLPDLLRRIRQTGDRVAEAQPDVLITIDSPDFCLRVAKRAKAAFPGLRVVHYVAPSVWAWRAGRAAKMAKVVDHVLALLPFEPPYMEAVGMSCDFVGHPVTTEALPTEADIAAFRVAEGLGDARCLTVLPGSRKGEVGRVGPVLRDVAAQLVAEQPDLRVLVPTVGPRLEMVREMFGAVPGAQVIGPEQDKMAAFAASELALAASGTVTLEVGAVGTPMIVAYDFNGLTRMMARRLVKLQSATLVNLLYWFETHEGREGWGRPVSDDWERVQDARVGDQPIPEFLLERCRADLIAAKAREYLGSAGIAAGQKAASARAMEMLGRGGDAPGLRAARSVLSFLER